ncbi:peptidylprolyl isomerase [Sulfitobacter aestuarii]|uniref:Parvulin-like PPIase n=1 Tax=Sulfitobacter aestuarii TaxID=2161676 RepID=A0ABW5TZF2_9RHOB
MQRHLTYLAPLAFAASFALPAFAQETPSEAPQDETAAEAETNTESGAGTTGDATIDTVVATVNGTEITLGHMMVARARLPEQYQQLPAEVLFTGILDQLIQQTALAEQFTGELPPRVKLSLDNETRSLTAGEVIEGVMNAEISDADLQAAYDEQYASVEPSDEYNASHILVESEEEAKAIKKELDEGADFAAVAREKSTGPSGPGGGSLGWFGPGSMVPSFEEAVMDMEVGAISAPVETQFGWHVIKLNETRKSEAPALDEVRDELEMQVRQTRVQSHIEELTEAADVDKEAASTIDPSILTNIEMLE